MLAGPRIETLIEIQNAANLRSGPEHCLIWINPPQTLRRGWQWLSGLARREYFSRAERRNL